MEGMWLVSFLSADPQLHKHGHAFDRNVISGVYHGEIETTETCTKKTNSQLTLITKRLDSELAKTEKNYILFSIVSPL